MKVLGIFALCILAAPAMRAQSGPDQFGRITDIDGHAILGAEIVASCTGKSNPIVFHVDEKGDYGIGFGEPNGIDCSLEIRAQGYETISVPKGNFHECANVRVNYTMSAIEPPTQDRQDADEAYVKSYVSLTLRDGAGELPPPLAPCVNGGKPPEARADGYNFGPDDLPCRNITLVLTNHNGSRDVHIVYDTCHGPDITFDLQQNGQWHPIVRPKVGRCVRNIQKSLLLPAGSSLIWPMHIGDRGLLSTIEPGTHLVRAHWRLAGCVGPDQECTQPLDNTNERVPVTHQLGSFVSQDVLINDKLSQCNSRCYVLASGHRR